MIMSGANLVYVQKQLGHSSIQLTVDTYTHWIQLAERNAVLEVDRLLALPEENGCTPTGALCKVLDAKEEKWGEWMDDYRTFWVEHPDLGFSKFVVA